jgi:hypothetical protein
MPKRSPDLRVWSGTATFERHFVLDLWLDNYPAKLSPIPAWVTMTMTAAQAKAVKGNAASSLPPIK